MPDAELTSDDYDTVPAVIGAVQDFTISAVVDSQDGITYARAIDDESDGLTVYYCQRDPEAASDDENSGILIWSGDNADVSVDISGAPFAVSTVSVDISSLTEEDIDGPILVNPGTGEAIEAEGVRIQYVPAE